LKESINLEVQLNLVYSNYLKSTSLKFVVDELSETAVLNLNNFKKLIEGFMDEKGKHQETIVETLYLLEAKETETRRQMTPLSKYQNPHAWIHESTIHTFISTPVSSEQ
jgi:hypothetical protein